MSRMPWEEDDAGLSDEVEDASYTIETPRAEEPEQGLGQQPPEEENGRHRGGPADRFYREPKRLSEKTEADVYMSIAPEVITKVLSSRKRAVEWWVMEEEHRKRYGLSQAQEQELIDLLARTWPKEES